MSSPRTAMNASGPDLVKRQFKAQGPNELWVADITFVPTSEGFLYLATVLDVFSRKVVGWSMAEEMPTDLVLSALDMALQTRRPKAVIHHSDQGSQYTSMAFRKRCEQAGVRLSMGSVGDAYDNAMAESFFATLECELIARRNWKTRAEAKAALFCWIEGWYNPRRLHSGVGYLSPNQFERRYAEQHGRRRPGFTTASVGSSQAPTAAVHKCAPLATRTEST
jgi:putative transposase